MAAAVGAAAAVTVVQEAAVQAVEKAEVWMGSATEVVELVAAEVMVAAMVVAVGVEAR